MGPLHRLVLAACLLLPAVAVAGPPRPVVDFSEQAEARPEDFTIDDAIVHTPQVGYVLTRQRQEDLEQLQLKEPLVPKILQSLRERPF